MAYREGAWCTERRCGMQGEGSMQGRVVCRRGRGIQGRVRYAGGGVAIQRTRNLHACIRSMRQDYWQLHVARAVIEPARDA